MNEFHKSMLNYIGIGLAGLFLMILINAQREETSPIVGFLLVLALPVAVGILGGLTGALPFVKSPEQREKERKEKLDREGKQ